MKNNSPVRSEQTQPKQPVNFSHRLANTEHDVTCPIDLVDAISRTAETAKTILDLLQERVLLESDSVIALDSGMVFVVLNSVRDHILDMESLVDAFFKATRDNGGKS